MAHWRLVTWLVLLSVASAGAQTKAPARETRVALVIGNAAYTDAPLNNPANDARGMAQALRDQGFEVIDRVNADATTMRRAVAQFGEKLKEGGVGLFYYSGHGMQVNGRNFLIPIAAQIPSEAYVSAETLDVDSVLGQMDAAKSRVNIVILDACRNNPFARRFRSQTRGLAFMQAPLGTFIAYATSPGDVADDGPRGGYGVFTGELLKVLQEPLQIEALFKHVGLAVQQKTERRQTPWVASNLTGDFAFASRPVVASVAPAPPPRLEIKEEVRQQLGSLALTAKIDSVQVWLGDQQLGETRLGRALIINNVAEGPHRLRATKPGHKEWTRDIRVVANQRSEIVIDIEPLLTQPIKGLKGDEVVRARLSDRTLAEYAKFLETEGARAFAVAENGASGIASKRDTRPKAIFGALYHCNKFARNVCRVFAVNDEVVIPRYTVFEDRSQQLIRALPRERFMFSQYGDERRDAGVAATSALRKEPYHTDTPLTVPGARTVTTVELVKLMISSTPPVLIDALEGEGHKTIPGAYWIRGAGWHGSDDVNAEIRERLGYVLEGLTRGSKDTALIFFCEGPQCWLSYNAALRARDLGYGNVQWYRGGVTAWDAAKLETIDAVQYGQVR